MPQKKKKRKPRSRARGGAAPQAAAQPSVEASPASQEKRRERMEARREAKARAAVQARRRQRMARLTRIVVLVAAASAIVWFLFLRNSIPDAIAGHEVEHFDPFISESSANTLHTDQSVSYASNPPVSGQHSPIPADCGVYDQQLPNERMVHTLEHGAVGILYNPEEPRAEIKRIEDLVNNYESHTFSAPYAGLDPPYAVVAWAHMMRLDSFDQDAAEEFIDFFRSGGDAPEKEQDCPLTAESPFQGPTPTPTPTLSVQPRDPTPDEDKGDEKKNDN